jgi:Trk-type K+ transport system membrane component
MYAVATFLVVAVITVAFTKLATGALIATGVPPESAAFQARSAFSGAGFTTTEAENVVNHRVRRRIIGTTMFVGSLGTPTLVLTVLVGFVAPGPGSTTERALVTISGVFLIVMAVFNKPSQRWLQRVGQRYVHKRLAPAALD